MPILSRLDEVAQTLAKLSAGTENHSQQRVKKLLVYACYGSWEGEAAQLNQHHWLELLRSLQQTAPTLDRLQAHLTNLVKTLNKPAEYALVANVILNCCRPLYMVPSTPPYRQQRYDQIVAQLNEEPDTQRIKKLLVCACHHVWENDAARLNRISFVELVQTLHSLAPQCEQLEAVLNSIVKTLNRQGHYQIVAQRIMQLFAPLYQQELETTATLPGVPQCDREALPSESRPVTAQPSSLPLSAQVDALLFDVRLEILKYANPLQVKLLLFSALHEPIDLQQLRLLKTDDLDQLLRSIVHLHPTPTGLDLHLNDVAQQLPGDFGQTARVIARSLQVLYRDSALRDYLRGGRSDGAASHTAIASGYTGQLASGQLSSEIVSSATRPFTAAAKDGAVPTTAHDLFSV